MVNLVRARTDNNARANAGANLVKRRPQQTMLASPLQAQRQILVAMVGWDPLLM